MMEKRVPVSPIEVDNWDIWHKSNQDLCRIPGHGTSIVPIPPMSFQTSIPLRPIQVRCTFQWPLSGHQQVSCTLEWSLRGHQHILFNHSQRTSKGNSRKPRMKEVSNFINICRTNSIQVLNQHEHFRKKILCPSNAIFGKTKINQCWYLGPAAKTGNVLGIKQTNVIPK